MVIMDTLFHSVPAGEPSAETARQIWTRFGDSTPGPLRKYLRETAVEGQISVATRTGLLGWPENLYFR